MRYTLLPPLYVRRSDIRAIAHLLSPAHAAGILIILLHLTTDIADGQTTERLVSTDVPALSTFLGSDISMHNGMALIGASGAEGFVGAAYIFERADTSWIQRATLKPANGVQNDGFGTSVVLKDNIAIVGAPGFSESRGAVFVYEFEGGAWVQKQLIQALDRAPGDEFGKDIAMDGDIIVIGAPNKLVALEDKFGAAYIFERQGDRFAERTRLDLLDVNGQQFMGTSVSIHGTTAVISSTSGVFVYEQLAGSWLRTDKLETDDGVVVFGPIAFDGKDIFTQAFPLSDLSMRVFSRANGEWVESGKITALDEVKLGYSISVDSDQVVIGYQDCCGINLAYVFEKVEGSWVQAAKLRPTTRAGFDHYGSAVDIDQGVVLVGAPNAFEILGRATRGAVYDYRTPVEAPELLSPDNDAFDIPTTVSLSWSEVSNNRGYQLQVGRDQLFQDLVVDSLNITSTSLTLRDLEVNHTYFWRVRSLREANADGWSSTWSEVRTFSTLNIPAPVLASPSNGAIDVPSTETLIWNASTPADAYDIQLATDTEFTAIVQESIGLRDTLYVASSLESSTTYFWRIRAQLNEAVGPYSESFSFTTLDLGSPQLTEPANGSTEIPTTIVLDWDSVNNADSYVLQLALEASFNEILLEENGLSSTSAEISGLEPGTVYFWRVRGQFQLLEGPFSQVFTFTTITLGVPVAIAPLDNSFPEGPNVAVSWQSLDAADQYRLQIAKDPSFSIVEMEEENLTDTGFLVRDLDPYSTYFWRVEAITGGVSSGFSEVRAFTPYPSSITVSHDRTFGDIGEMQSWRMVGLPGNVDIALSSVMTGNPEDDWQAYHDNGSVEGNLSPFTPSFRFRPGRGFWVLSKDSLSIDQQVSSLPLAVDGTVTVALQDGWNIVTSPFEEPVSWDLVLASNEGVVEDLWRFNGSFRQSNNLEPYEGFYFFNADNRSQLRIPIPIDNSTGVSASVESGVGLLELIAIAKYDKKSSVIIGQHEEAKAGLDALDRFSPPTAFNTIDIRLINQALPTSHKGLHKEFRKKAAHNQTYDVLLSGKAGELVQLEAVLGDALHSKEVYLIDGATSQRYDLRSNAKTGIRLEQDEQMFHLIVGSAAFVEGQMESYIPDYVQLMSSYPNPMNQETHIPYAVASAKGSAEVQLDVFDILGRKIKRLVGESQKEGVYEVTWDGRDNKGIDVASGVYLVRLQVEKQSQTRQIIVVR